MSVKIESNEPCHLNVGIVVLPSDILTLPALSLLQRAVEHNFALTDTECTQIQNAAADHPLLEVSGPVHLDHFLTLKGSSNGCIRRLGADMTATVTLTKFVLKHNAPIVRLGFHIVGTYGFERVKGSAVQKKKKVFWNDTLQVLQLKARAKMIEKMVSSTKLDFPAYGRPVCMTLKRFKSSC